MSRLLNAVFPAMLFAAGANALRYTIYNNCPSDINLWYNEFDLGTLGTGAKYIQDPANPNGAVFYTPTRGPAFYPGADVPTEPKYTLAKFLHLYDAWHYFVQRDELPYQFNTGISIIPDVPVTSDGKFCTSAICQDGTCSTAFTSYPTDVPDVPPRGTIPEPPMNICHDDPTPVSNFNVTFCPDGHWPLPAAGQLMPILLNTNKCLEVRGSVGEWGNGSPVDIRDCNGSDAQSWYIQQGSTRVQLAHTNFCLDAGSTPGNGVPMKIWTCYNNLPAQEWVFQKNNGTIELNGTRLCLDVDGSDVTNGKTLQTWGCGNLNPNQLWTVTNVLGKK